MAANRSCGNWNNGGALKGNTGSSEVYKDTVYHFYQPGLHEKMHLVGSLGPRLIFVLQATKSWMRAWARGYLVGPADVNLVYIFSQGDEYSSWAAGCRMTMKGKALAKQGYEQELSSLRAFVAMQNKADSGASPTGDHVSDM